MKPDERALEKQLKRILLGEQPDLNVLVIQWKALGRIANHLMIRTFNRSNAWQLFTRWAAGKSEITELVQDLSSTAGISKEGLDALRQAGLSRSESNDAHEALSIVDQIASKHNERWETFWQRLKTNENIFDGVLLLLESSPNDSSAQFVHALLDQGFSKEQETRIRKLLYQFRQKGIRVEEEATKVQASRELFFFGENKLPQWQPILYFRPHSSFSSTGDLLVLRIIEGSECPGPEQQRNLSLNQASLKQIAVRYSEQLQKQLGIHLQFHLLKNSYARYLLQCSAELIPEAASQPIKDFLKFIGNEPAENPFESLPEQSGTFLSTDFLLTESYFAHWMLNPHDVEGYLNDLAALEKGPIILTGAALVAKKQEIRTAVLQKVFSGKERALWAFAFRKAAFYLRDMNSTASAASHQAAKQLEDLETLAENVEILRVLFDRTAEYVQGQQKAKQEEERKTSLIVTPDEFRKNR